MVGKFISSKIRKVHHGHKKAMTRIPSGWSPQPIDRIGAKVIVKKEKKTERTSRIPDYIEGKLIQ